MKKLMKRLAIKNLRMKALQKVILLKHQDPMIILDSLFVMKGTAFNQEYWVSSMDGMAIQNLNLRMDMYGNKAVQAFSESN